MEELFLSCLFKFFMILFSVSIFLYAVIVEKDVLKGLLILNIITNYRMILFHLTDLQSEVMNRREVVYKMPARSIDGSQRGTFINRTLSYPISDERPNPTYYAYDYPLSNKIPWWENEP